MATRDQLVDALRAAGMVIAVCDLYPDAASQYDELWGQAVRFFLDQDSSPDLVMRLADGWADRWLVPTPAARDVVHWTVQVQLSPSMVLVNKVTGSLPDQLTTYGYMAKAVAEREWRSRPANRSLRWQAQLLRESFRALGFNPGKESDAALIWAAVHHEAADDYGLALRMSADQRMPTAVPSLPTSENLSRMIGPLYRLLGAPRQRGRRRRDDASDIRTSVRLDLTRW